jgi:hypothetical protein
LPLSILIRAKAARQRSLRVTAKPGKDDLMRATLLLCAVMCAFALASLSIGVGSHAQELRGQAKQMIARVESSVLGYEPLPERGL